MPAKSQCGDLCVIRALVDQRTTCVTHLWRA